MDYINIYHQRTGFRFRIDGHYKWYVAITLIFGKTKDRFYKELRVHNPRWWKTTYDKKGKIDHQGVIFEIKG